VTHPIRVGCSGWQYADWREAFYPRGCPQRRWLEHYATVFDTVEVNTTFYRLTKAETVARWVQQTPRGFTFAVKGSRYLTHMKRLKDPGAGIDRYFELILRLGRKLSVVLWQLPPQMDKADPDRLAQFLEKLPRKNLRHAVEFRSASWYVEPVCAVLDAYGAAFCEHDLVPLQPPRLTGGFRYLRFHGATGKYRGRYGKRALRPFARSLLAHPGDAYVYFNNDHFGHAIRDAIDLGELIGEPLHSTDALRDARRSRAAAVE
jgi:uncharacterized protein YecE (DUF72 family)